MKAVILAGGFGKRLRPYTDKTPKSLIKVAGRPILEHQILWLRKQGIEEFILLVGYKREKILEYFGNGERLGVKIEYSIEEEPLGTGGAIKNAKGKLKNTSSFLILNGDILTDLRILPLIDSLNKDVVGVLALVPLPSPYGIVEFDDEGYILRFREKPLLEDYWINAGVYLFNESIFEYLPDKGDIEKITFPTLADEGLLKAVKYQGVFWRSIDTFKDIEYIEKYREKYNEYFTL
jgi:NDP-sugar pyrophosphorylase family protein